MWKMMKIYPLKSITDGMNSSNTLRSSKPYDWWLGSQLSLYHVNLINTWWILERIGSNQQRKNMSLYPPMIDMNRREAKSIKIKKGMLKMCISKTYVDVCVWIIVKLPIVLSKWMLTNNNNNNQRLMNGWCNTSKQWCCCLGLKR